ncbi:hypothetical protein BH24GEM1_BH24GEM1_15630 [soil metagenome]
MAEPQPEPERPVVVLIAEDEDVVRATVARVLWGEGYRTLEAPDGAEALHLAHLTWPHLHLVITDVMMPTVDGLELGRRLAVACPALPVLYMSGYCRGDIFNRDGPGADAPFLRKPFNNEDLLAKVRDLLDATKHTSGLDFTCPQLLPDLQMRDEQR